MIYIMGVVLCALLTAFDQITKHMAEARLEYGEPIVLIKNVFELNFLRNDGAAFGIFGGGRWALIILTIVIFAGLIVFYIKLPKSRNQNWYRLAMILIASGALGNFVDRARQGFVVDFFYFRLINFPLFNMADTYITVGCAVIIVLTLFFSEKEKSAGGEKIIGSEHGQDEA